MIGLAILFWVSRATWIWIRPSFEHYGKQEGSLKGHNPRKHGRPSHHPLLAVLSEEPVFAYQPVKQENKRRGFVAALDLISRLAADLDSG